MRVIDQFDTQKDEMAKRKGDSSIHLSPFMTIVRDIYFTQTQCLLTIIHSLSFDCPQIQRKEREDTDGRKMDDNLINRIRSLGPFRASAIHNLFYRLSFFFTFITRNVHILALGFFLIIFDLECSLKLADTTLAKACAICVRKPQIVKNCQARKLLLWAFRRKSKDVLPNINGLQFVCGCDLTCFYDHNDCLGVLFANAEADGEKRRKFVSSLE